MKLKWKVYDVDKSWSIQTKVTVSRDDEADTEWGDCMGQLGTKKQRKHTERNKPQFWTVF